MTISQKDPKTLQHRRWSVTALAKTAFAPIRLPADSLAPSHSIYLPSCALNSLISNGLTLFPVWPAYVLVNDFSILCYRTEVKLWNAFHLNNEIRRMCSSPLKIKHTTCRGKLRNKQGKASSHDFLSFREKWSKSLFFFLPAELSKPNTKLFSLSLQWLQVLIPHIPQWVFSPVT